MTRHLQLGKIGSSDTMIWDYNTEDEDASDDDGEIEDGEEFEVSPVLEPSLALAPVAYLH